MFHSKCLDISQAPDLESFRRGLQRFADEREFGLFSAALMLELPEGTRAVGFVSNMPATWAEYFTDEADGQRDPVLQHLRHRLVPLRYDRHTYVEAGAADLWETQAKFGYRSGVACKLLLHQGRHFLFGLDRDQDVTKDPNELARQLADLQMFAVHAQEAAIRLLLPELRQRYELPGLSEREREVLQWTRDGKSRWAVGQILSISENTVKFHLANACRKLDVGSAQEAALKAMSFELI